MCSRRLAGTQRCDTRAHGQHRINAPAPDLNVAGRDLDILEARRFQDAAHAVWISKCERPGRVRIVVRLRRQMSRRGPKRRDVEQWWQPTGPRPALDAGSGGRAMTRAPNAPLGVLAPVPGPQKIRTELIEAGAADLAHDQVDLGAEDIDRLFDAG